ncbi:MAG: DUF1080 domain-containing protein [Pedosphaera sp.]|nr:DUF1080 domain-containing protein [Pedosphaera sp.]
MAWVNNVICFLLLIRGVAQTSEPTRTASPTNGSIPLFNQRDLTGFYPWLVDTGLEDPRRVFTVTNGLIRISGNGLGYLATREAYKDYHLIAEFRWGRTNWPWGDRVGRARDSGIFLHAIGPDGNSHDGKGAFMAAIECNIFQGATGDFLLIRGNASDGSLIAPRIIAETADSPDAYGWFTWRKGGGAAGPWNAGAASIGSGKTRTGRISGNSAVLAMSKARSVNGPAWSACVMAITLRSRSMASW